MAEPGGFDVAAQPAESIYERVRGDILVGQLRPGERLKLEALRERYDASVNTLREVLSRLVSQGLVVNEEQKGFVVAPATLADLIDITGARLLIEGHAVGLSIQHGDLEWEAGLVAAHYRLASIEAVLNRDPDAYAVLLERYNREFHAALISACGSRWLIHLHGLMYDQSRRYRALSFQVKNFPREQSRDEHRAILDAALRRDAEAVVALLSAHVLKGVELYREEDVAAASAPGPKAVRGPGRPKKESQNIVS